MTMQRRIWGGVFAFLCAVMLAGCGENGKVGIVSGTITDVDGNPVADAEVFAANAVNSRTRSLHNGTYYLTNVPDRFTIIRARAVIGGKEYTGQNVAQVFESEQSKNVNIMIAPADRQGAVEGFVRDALGRGIEGARVFAGGALSSALAVTDRRGFYRITGLPAGFEYPIVASAPDYENDKRTVSIVAGETALLSFTLNDSRNRPVCVHLRKEDGTLSVGGDAARCRPAPSPARLGWQAQARPSNPARPASARQPSRA